MSSCGGALDVCALLQCNYALTEEREVGEGQTQCKGPTFGLWSLRVSSPVCVRRRSRKERREGVSRGSACGRRSEDVGVCSLSLCL